MRVGGLQDVKSWIWAPEQIVCSVSVNGQDFDVFGRGNTAMSPEDYTPQTERLSFEGDAEARYLKLELSQFNGGQIPEWHLGRLNPTWVFADELEFDVQPLK